MTKKDWKKAWIITKKTNPYADAPEIEILNILDSRIGSDKIRWLLNHLMLRDMTYIGDKHFYGKHPEKYPCRANLVNINGVPWAGKMNGGHNPVYEAKIAYINLETGEIDEKEYSIKNTTKRIEELHGKNN